MTEGEWLHSKDAKALLAFIRHRGSERQLRLFACARCRRVWRLLTDPSSRDAVEVAEWFAGGLVGEEDLAAVRAAAETARDALGRAADEAWLAWRLAEERRWRPGPGEDLADAELTFRRAEHAWALAWTAAFAVRPPGRLKATEAEDDLAWGCPVPRREPASVLGRPPAGPFDDEPASLLREVFGNPFRPAVVEPGWLACNGGAARGLAAVIYEEQRFGDLPVLADALEEAGCADAPLLAHCRGGGEHVRGCWALAAVLGRG